MEKFVYKKKYGQNFLQDENILSKIATSLPINEDDLVIEIGPGKGSLTRYLKKTNAYVFCYEIDEETKPDLDKLTGPRLKIKYGDFLQTDIKSDIAKIKYNKLYIVANLPYYITTQIIKKLIEAEINIEAMCLMVQKEVAERFAAQPGCKDYGSLTIYLNYFFQIRKSMAVSRNYFKPVPKVDSAVVIFEANKEKMLLNNEKLFFEIVRSSFRHKRKNIKNNLYDYDLKKIEQILNKYSLSLTSRAEQIPLAVFADIANNLNIVEK